MKKVLLVVLMLILTATIANATSINGDFKGNPIVKVNANGNELTVENTPAVIYNGNTLVPIYMLRQLGAEVTWNAKTYSVDVSLPNKEDNNYESMKAWAQVSDYYSRLNNLTTNYVRIIERLNASGRSADLSYDNQYVSSIFEEVANLIDYLIVDYDNLVRNYSSITRENYTNMNYSHDKINTIENNLNELINNFLRALELQLAFYKNKTDENFNSFVNEATQAHNKLEKTKSLIEEERLFFQNGIIYYE